MSNKCDSRAINSFSLMCHSFSASVTAGNSAPSSLPAVTALSNPLLASRAMETSRGSRSALFIPVDAPLPDRKLTQALLNIGSLVGVAFFIIASALSVPVALILLIFCQLP